MIQDRAAENVTWKPGPKTLGGITAGVAMISYIGLYGGVQSLLPSTVILVLALCSPAILLAVCFVSRDPNVIAGSMIHAACLTLVLAVGTWMSQHQRGLDSFLYEGATILLIVEVVVIYFAATARSHATTLLKFFPVLIVSLLAGWVIGYFARSETRPSLILTAARHTAQQSPYCLVVGGRTVTSRRDLTGWAMASSGGKGRDFWALLVVGGAGKPLYANWSHGLGHFDPVREGARAGLHLDDRKQCEPEQDFVAKF